ncbi:MAG TPA: hypothetical protein VN253_08010 [Kofleriaceae bacterium]|nr:hypothetical protein [Kofleriaceae bacterium]
MRGGMLGERESRMFVVQLAMGFMMACGRPAPVPAPAPRNQARAVSVADLVRRADEALTASRPPDYRRPQMEGPDPTRQVKDLYWKACRAGDRRSCWIADAMGHGDAKAIIRRNCRAGDLMSCRALSPEFEPKPDRRLHGWAGRADPCDTPECQETQRQECTDGFPVSCERLDSAEPHDPFDPGPLLQRAGKLALDGCRAGILEECSWLEFGHRDLDEKALAAEQLCILALKDCRYAYKDPIVYRDLMERGCQYGKDEEQRDTCRWLGNGYYDLQYPEPYPGRAREIGEWNCARKRDPAKCLKELEARTPTAAP